MDHVSFLAPVWCTAITEMVHADYRNGASHLPNKWCTHLTEKWCIVDYRLQQAFKALVKDHSDELLILAYLLTKDRNAAKTVVDNVLIDVWNKVIELSEPIYPFLTNQVRAACGIE